MGEFPKTIGRYEVLDRLGAGEVSVVYKARDPLLKRLAAIKTLSSGIEPGNDGGQWREQLRVDIEAASKLDHPHIVRLLDAGLEAESFFVVMDLVAGEPLVDIRGNVEALGLRARREQLDRLLDQHAERLRVRSFRRSPAHRRVLPIAAPA